jgi:hypothetical protein
VEVIEAHVKLSELGPAWDDTPVSFFNPQTVAVAVKAAGL